MSLLTYNNVWLTFGGNVLEPEPPVRPFSFLELYLYCDQGNGNLEADQFIIWNGNGGHYATLVGGYGDYTQTEKSGWYYTSSIVSPQNGWHDLTTSEISDINNGTAPFLHSFKYARLIFSYTEYYTLTRFSFRHLFNSGLNLPFSVWLSGLVWDASTHTYSSVPLGNNTFTPTTSYGLCFIDIQGA